MNKLDILCIGTALIDSIIKGFDPNPISASGFIADSGSLNVGGEAVNEAVTAAKLGAKTGILCSLGQDAAGDMIINSLKSNGNYLVDTMIPYFPKQIAQKGIYIYLGSLLAVSLLFMDYSMSLPFLLLHVVCVTGSFC